MDQNSMLEKFASEHQLTVHAEPLNGRSYPTYRVKLTRNGGRFGVCWDEWAYKDTPTIVNVLKMLTEEWDCLQENQTNGNETAELAAFGERINAPIRKRISDAERLIGFDKILSVWKITKLYY